MSDFDPYRAAIAEPEPSCPKCGWVARRGDACEACGLIFERYAAAQRRAAAQPVESVGLPPSTPAVMPVFNPRDHVADVSATGIVGAAVTSSFAALLTLIGINLLPFLALIVVAVAAGAGAAILAGPLARVGVIGQVAIAVPLFIIVLRGAAAVMAASLFVVDDQLRSGDNRGVVAGLRDGWAVSMNVIGAMLVAAVVACVPMVTLVWLRSPTAIAVVAVATLAWWLYVGVRLAFVAGEIVLGGAGISDAVSESLRQTADHVWATTKVVVLGSVVVVAISSLGSAIAVVPVVGWLVSALCSVVVGGIWSGVSAGLWRARQ